MRIVLVYSTRSGNTKKLAERAYEALEGEKTLFSITETSCVDIDDALVVVGFPIMNSRVEPRAARFLASLPEKTRLVLFVTHGSKRDATLVSQVIAQAKVLVSPIEFVGYCTSQGEVSSKVLDKLARGSKPPEWLNEAEAARGHPDSDDVSRLVALINGGLVRG